MDQIRLLYLWRGETGGETWFSLILYILQMTHIFSIWQLNEDVLYPYLGLNIESLGPKISIFQGVKGNP